MKEWLAPGLVTSQLTRSGEDRSYRRMPPWPWKMGQEVFLQNRRAICGTKGGQSSCVCCVRRDEAVVCGIVGYIGYRNACSVLLDGLKRLEYRVYDSVGIAVNNSKKIEIIKEAGRVSDLERIVKEIAPSGTQGIGNARWANHGGVSVVKAHSCPSRDKHFILAHNGIIENCSELKETLLAEGFNFTSERDTEVIAQLLMKFYDGDVLKALTSLQGQLKGSYALAIVDEEDMDHIYCMRGGFPMVLGMGEGESLCATDTLAILPYTKNVISMDDGDIAELSSQGIKLYDAKGSPLQKKNFFIDWDLSSAEKRGYPHFMLKEIHEQGGAFRSTLEGRLINGGVDFSGELALNEEVIKRLRAIHLVACGTSYYASLIAERAFERWCDLDIKVDVASEYRYRNIRLSPNTLAVFVSQSGETADTLAAQRRARELGAYSLAVTNAQESTLASCCDDVLLLKAGPEIGVAATKTFTGQIAVLYLLAIYIAKVRGTLTPRMEKELIDELIRLPYKIEATLEREHVVEELASNFSGSQSFLFFGRGISYPVALEGALKLKEVSYIHAEAFAAGEMKHGPIALIDSNVPVLIVAPKDSLHEKTLSSIKEAKARRAPVIAVGFDGDEQLANDASHVLYVPPTREEFSPFVTVVPLQLLAYYMAKKRGCEIDSPRHLTKSVTEE